MKRKLIIVVAVMLALGGCTRNRPSDKPPIHLNPNMDDQERYETQGSSEFFADGSAMRTPVEGTVPRGWMRNNIEFITAHDPSGELVKTNPLPVNMKLLLRGQKRYNIYCAPCHSELGDGRGILVKRGYIPPPPFDDPRLLDLPDGHFFEVMTNGIRNMPSYKSQIPAEDRWAIVAYLRVLQRTKTATLEDIPDSMRNLIK